MDQDEEAYLLKIQDRFSGPLASLRQRLGIFDMAGIAFVGHGMMGPAIAAQLASIHHREEKSRVLIVEDEKDWARELFMHEGLMIPEPIGLKPYDLELPALEMAAAPDLPRMKHRGPNIPAADYAKRLKKKRANQRKARSKNRKKRK